MKVIIKTNGKKLRTIYASRAEVRKRLTEFAVAHGICRHIAPMLAWRVTEARQPTSIASGMVAELAE